MRKKWIVTFFDLERKPRTRRFWTLDGAAHFRLVMQDNIHIRERDNYTATVWHEDDVR